MAGAVSVFDVAGLGDRGRARKCERVSSEHACGRAISITPLLPELCMPLWFNSRWMFHCWPPLPICLVDKSFPSHSREQRGIIPAQRGMEWPLSHLSDVRPFFWGGFSVRVGCTYRCGDTYLVLGYMYIGICAKTPYSVYDSTNIFAFINFVWQGSRLNIKLCLYRIYFKNLNISCSTFTEEDYF